MTERNKILADIADYISYLINQDRPEASLRSLEKQFKDASEGNLSSNIADGLIQPLLSIYSGEDTTDKSDSGLFDQTRYITGESVGFPQRDDDESGPVGEGEREEAENDRLASQRYSD